MDHVELWVHEEFGVQQNEAYHIGVCRKVLHEIAAFSNMDVINDEGVIVLQ